MPSASNTYRGRLAPSPTGHLHLGHARTFWIAQERAQKNHGTLILRMEDLDKSRCRPEFSKAVIEDLAWFGFVWQEGPDVGGPHAPYVQSERMATYRQAFETLKLGGAVYPCTCSRQDVLRAAQAPHAGEDEPVYPGTCREKDCDPETIGEARVSWRFRVPDGERIAFVDGGFGPQAFTAGVDFGDFVVWRHDDVPSYQLSVVADDAAMGITEVVRGEDLLRSTARQILLYRALGIEVPAFYHCKLMTDENGMRLAKRSDALSLRTLRETGASRKEIREKLFSKALISIGG